MFSPARIIKAIVLFILLTFTVGSLPADVLAATDGTAQPARLAPNVPDDQHTKVQTLLIDTMSALLCQLVGVDPVRPQHGCVTFNASKGTFGYVKPGEPGNSSGGLLGSMGRMIGSTYQIPVHTEDYTNYLASNFGVTKRTLAAEAVDDGGGNGGATPDAQEMGTGFSSMRSLLGLWTRLRDLTYLVFVVVFVLIGLGIMLRIKMDPRTVMTIQNQIPRVIISILLITFSYAIAGFLIDVMWLSTYLGINIIASQAPAPCDPDVLTSVATNNLLTTPFHYVGAIFKVDGCPVNYGIKELSWGVGMAVGDVITSVIASIFGTDGRSAGDSLCSSWDPSSWGTCILEGAEDIIYWVFSLIIGIVAALIIAIAIFASLFRVWIALLKSMIYVLVFTVMGPIWILLGLLPSTKNFGFEQWLRHIVSALAPFPAIAMLYVAAAVVANDPVINNAGGTNFFLPPLVANPGISSNIGMAIAFGIILISPEIVNMVRDAFKVSSSKYVGGAITGGAAAGYAMAGAAVSPMAKNLFGKQKDGTWGPLTYYAGRWAGNKYPNVLKKFQGMKTAMNSARNAQLMDKQIVLNPATGGLTYAAKPKSEADAKSASPGGAPASGDAVSANPGDETPNASGEQASGTS